MGQKPLSLNELKEETIYWIRFKKHPWTPENPWFLGKILRIKGTLIHCASWKPEGSTEEEWFEFEDIRIHLSTEIDYQTLIESMI